MDLMYACYLCGAKMMKILKLSKKTGRFLKVLVRNMRFDDVLCPNHAPFGVVLFVEPKIFERKIWSLSFFALSLQRHIKCHEQNTFITNTLTAFIP